MNNQTTPVVSTLLKNKLGRQAIRLQQHANPLGAGSARLQYNTLEKVVIESVKILSNFYKNLSEPGYTPVEVVPDTVPDEETFNNNFVSIQDDLVTVFNEFENLEGVILGEFNYIVSRLNRLNRRLKAVSSSLGDFILFSDLPTKDAVFFGDSFNNLNRVEINSPLINTEQCEVNQVEGIVTLPIDRQAQVKLNVTEIPVINSNSNGIAGNNQELNAQLHGTISDILDNNADTWFEYERVVSTDDGVALVLDFTINIGDSQVINFIRINPNNFGTRTQVEVVAIDTSVDGKDFVSIKDDIPIAGFTVEDEENVFSLAPSTSKFAGQGLYTFTPRKAKYVHLTLKQSTSYPVITTGNVTKQRYAIGIRDVDIQALPYKTEGEVISANYYLSDEIRKVVLLANQNPSPETISNLVSIEHFVSPDNGVTWYAIRPKVSAGQADTTQTIPELLDFNGVIDNTIITSNPVQSVRYKAVLTRNTDAFVDDSAELAQEIGNNTELHTPPSTTPFEIFLQNQPIDGTLKLIDPQFGSRGKEEVKYNIALGTGNKLNILLPFKPLVRDFEKDLSGTYPALIDKDPERIYIDGELWDRGTLSGVNNHYRLNYEEGRLEFGDGTNGNEVTAGGIVSMTLCEERIFPSRGTDHIAELNYPTSNDKKQIEIYLISPPKSNTIVLKKGSKRHPLLPDIIYDSSTSKAYTSGAYKIVLSDNTVFANEQTFVDGSTEFSSSGDYSFDFANGMLYSYDATSSSTDTSIIYFYNPRTQLDEDEWSFTDAGDGIANAVSISDNVFQTFTADPLVIPAGVKYFNLTHLGAVRGTVEFTTSSGTLPTELSQEIEYIDGRSELLGVINAIEQLDAITDITGDTVIEISFGMKISSDTSFSVTFSNQSVFQDEKASYGAISSVGDYYIDRAVGSTGKIYVKVDDNISDPGKVTYYYINPQANLSGRYSVNYQRGEVFTYDSTPSNITVNHEYTDYRARYDIARLVPSDDWEYIAKDKKITIKDREILKNHRTPQSIGQAGTSINKYYQASYQYVEATRANVSELEPFFTATLKDYSLKVISKSRLV